MTTITIAQFDDAAKKALLKAVADRGYANGLKAAATLAMIKLMMRCEACAELSRATHAVGMARTRRCLRGRTTAVRSQNVMIATGAAK